MSYRLRFIRAAALAVAALVLVPVGSALAVTPSAPASSVAPTPIPSNSADPNTSTAPGTVNFSVIPSRATGPDGRTTFVYHQIPGGTVIEDYIAVNNYSAQTETYTLGAADAYTNSSGSLTLDADNQPSTDIGSWVAFPKKTLTIPAHARVNEPFTLTVPRNVKPGDHTGGIYGEIKLAAGGGQLGVSTDNRVAIPVFLDVPGKVTTGLAITSLTTTYHGTLNPTGQGSTTVSYNVTNTGNVNLNGIQQVAITGPFGIPLASVKGPDLPELLPGKEFRVTVKVPGVFPLSWMTTKVTITPAETRTNTGSAPPPKVAKVTHSAGFWATPILLILLILLIGAGVWGGRLYFRYRREVRADQLYTAVEHARNQTKAELTGAGARDAGAKPGSGKPTDRA